MSGERRQCVRFLFLRLDPAWRRLPGEEQARQRAAFIAALADFQTRMLLRTYSLIGTRGDCDLLFWQAAADLETLQEFGTALFSTELGASLQVAYSYLAMTRRSEYDLAALTAQSDGTAVRPTDCRYLYVYPFVKKREWYRLPFEQREALMKEHVEVGRRRAADRRDQSRGRVRV